MPLNFNSSTYTAAYLHSPWEVGVYMNFGFEIPNELQAVVIEKGAVVRDDEGFDVVGRMQRLWNGTQR